RSNSSSRTQTQLIFKFFQVDGFKALIRLYDTFSRELTKHFEESKPDQSGHVKHDSWRTWASRGLRHATRCCGRRTTLRLRRSA
ncbi:hypothetical protein OC835_007879, partial [Tilletia horrida]